MQSAPYASDLHSKRDVFPFHLTFTALITIARLHKNGNYKVPVYVILFIPLLNPLFTAKYCLLKCISKHFLSFAWIQEQERTSVAKPKIKLVRDMPKRERRERERERYRSTHDHPWR